MANTTIKITQLPSIGNGLSASTLLPVVNTSGTAVTEKVTVGDVANYVLTQAGNTLSPAFLSTIAYSVSNASQPNITSVGTLSVNTLKISGGIVGYYLQTDGSGNLAWAPGGGGNGAVGGINTSVQFNDAGNFGANTGFTFNKTTGIFTSPFLAGNGNGLSNIQGANVSGFVANANVANTAFSVAGANVSGFVPNANVANTAFAVAAANVSGLGNIATINLTGSTTNVLYGNGVFAPASGGNANTGNIGFNNNVIYSNTGVVVNNSDLGNGQTAGLAVPSQGDGNAVLLFNSYGNVNLLAGNIGNSQPVKAWSFGADGNLTLPANTFAVNYANGTQVSLGGGNLSGIIVQDEGTNVVASANTINFVGNGVTASNVGGVATVTISGNSSQISNGNSNVSVPTSSDNVYINVNGGSSKQWIFDTAGNLRTPGNVDIYGAINFPQQVSSLNWSTYNIELSQYGRINTNVDFFANANTIGALYLKGDGSNISNIAVANVIGLGNIATANLDGSNSNVLYGNGVFAPVTGSVGSELVNGNNSFVLDVDGNVVFEGNVAGQAVDRGLVWDYGANANGVNSMVRQDGGGLTVRAWTENSGNFSAPVNIVTNQDANTMFWEFDGYGNLTLPGNLIVPTGNIVSDTLTLPFSSAITGITTGNATVIVAIADSVFPDPYSGTVTISGVIGTTEANGVWGYQAVEVNAFQLYTDATLTTPVDGTTWTAYVSGGTAVGVGLYSNLTIQGGNVSIGSNANSWEFDTTGNVTIPGSIVGTSTINIDNRATGNNADINLYSADDILIQARDRDIGSTAEGGDINILAGDSAEDSDTSAGDIIIEAGRGGASNIDFGGSGGFVRVEAGRGGAAVGANYSAQSGGSLTLNAGNAGGNNGNIDLGGSGGDVTINAGDSTGNGDPGGSIILRSGDAGANALAGQIQLIISSSDNGDGGTWTFDGAGIIQLPNSGTIGNEGNNIDIGSTSAISLEASTVVNIFTDTGTNAWQWQFQDDGNLRLPTIELDVGNTINEQTVIQSQRKIIPGLRYSAEINGTTPTVVYTATSVDTTSMKVTMQIQHTGLGMEFFDVSATYTGGNTYYTVSNRVQPPTISNSTVVVDLNGSNTMEITVTINSGAANSWVTYDATEFGIAVD